METLSLEEIVEAGLTIEEPIDGARLERLHDVALFDPDPDPDHVIAERNRYNYRTRRGRVCEYPDCEEKIHYIRTVPVCWKHEKTEFAEVHPAALPGSTIQPRLHGLRAARLARGLSNREIAEICGRSVKWAEQVDRCRDGVPHKLRALLADVLNVSEGELLEGAA